jgi:transposase
MSQPQYSDGAILDMLRTCKERYGKCTPDLFTEDDEFCSVSLVMRRFGSWSEGKQEAGIEEDLSSESGRPRQYTDEQVLSHLRELRRREGKVTTQLLSEHDDLVSTSVVVERFGTWLDAKERAGVATDERDFNSRPREYSDEDYKELLRKCEEKHGKVTQRTFDADDEFPSSGAVRKRFGSWSEAKEIAGIEPQGTGAPKYTQEKLLDMLRNCAEKHGGDCSAKQFAADEETCAPETLQRRFGSWNEAKRQAGLSVK